MVERYKGNAFKKGQKPSPNAGRKKGTPNKIPAFFKDAIAGAAEDLGELIPVYQFKDIVVRGKIKRVNTGKIVGWKASGIGGARGYLRWLGREYPGSYAALISRTLPLQINADIANRDTVAKKFSEASLAGLSLDQKMALMQDMIGATKPLPVLSKNLPPLEEDQVVDAEFTEIRPTANQGEDRSEEDRDEEDKAA